MIKKLSIGILFLVFSFATQAQFRITGKALDESKSPLAKATVTLMHQKDSSLIKTVVSNNDGSFLILDAPQDSLILTVEAIDHQQFVSFFNLNVDKDFGTIALDKKGQDLDVVTIIAKAPAVTVKGDTSQFSATEYKTNPDATTEDLIKKMPGITVARDGTVTAKGETVKKVTIDGKEFFGDDASIALRNLPAEVVDKIQVFDRLSDQAQLTGIDDGNSVRAINIVTKSGIKNGQFGRIYAGYGTNDRYSLGGNMSTFSGERRLSVVGNFNNINMQNFASQDLLGLTSSGGRGGGRGGWGGGNNFSVGQSPGIARTNALGINYNDKWGKKVTVSGSYFFNDSKLDNNSTSNKETFLSATKNLFTDDYDDAVSQNTNHRINMRIEYKIDSNNSVFVIPNLSFQKNNSLTHSNTYNYFGLNDSLSNSFGTYENDRNGYNLRNNIMFRHLFPNKKGRMFTLGFNSGWTKNDGEATSDATYRTFTNGGGHIDSLMNLFTDNATNGNSYGGNISYMEPVGKNAQIQIEYNPSVQKNKADQQTFLYDGAKYTIFDTTLSNRFDNTVTNNNAGLSYRWNKSRDEGLMIGVNYQNTKLESDRVFPTITSVDQSFNNLLPRVMYRKKFNNYNNIRLFYRASTDFPSISQLQDVVNRSNPLRLSSGNPSLKQEYSHNLMASYSYTNTKTNNSFFANFYLQTTQNNISNATFIASQDSTIQQGIVIPKGAQFVKPVNINGYQSLRSFFTYAMPLKSLKMNLNLNAGYTYSKLPGISNNLSTLTNNNVINTGIVLSSNISEYVDFNLSYSANFNNATTKIAGANTSNKYTNTVAGINLNLLNKQGWFIQNDVTNQTYNGMGTAFDQSYWLWNAAIGKKFLKNRVGELKLSVFDLLKQNQSISRMVTENYIQDSFNNVLQQYFMLTFTYSLKNFGKGPSRNSSNQENRGGFGGRPGGHGGPGMF